MALTSASLDSHKLSRVQESTTYPISSTITNSLPLISPSPQIFPKQIFIQSQCSHQTPMCSTPAHFSFNAHHSMPLCAEEAPSSCSISTEHPASVFSRTPTQDSKMSLSFLISPLPSSPNLKQTAAFASSTTSPDLDQTNSLQCAIYTVPTPSSDWQTFDNTCSSSDRDLDDDPSKPSAFKARKKAFIKSLTEYRAEKGYLTCKLCAHPIWGPNGKNYHKKSSHSHLIAILSFSRCSDPPISSYFLA